LNQSRWNVYSWKLVWLVQCVIKRPVGNDRAQL
jgi:hypothetical protein